MSLPIPKFLGFLTNKGFLGAPKQKPQHLWDNAGAGGKKGSFWVINSLGMTISTEGYDEPKEEFYDIKDRKLVANSIM